MEIQAEQTFINPRVKEGEHKTSTVPKDLNKPFITKIAHENSEDTDFSYYIIDKNQQDELITIHQYNNEDDQVLSNILISQQMIFKPPLFDGIPKRVFWSLNKVTGNLKIEVPTHAYLILSNQTNITINNPKKQNSKFILQKQQNNLDIQLQYNNINLSKTITPNKENPHLIVAQQFLNDDESNNNIQDELEFIDEYVSTNLVPTFESHPGLTYNCYNQQEDEQIEDLFIVGFPPTFETNGQIVILNVTDGYINIETTGKIPELSIERQVSYSLSNIQFEQNPPIQDRFKGELQVYTDEKQKDIFSFQN